MKTRAAEPTSASRRELRRRVDALHRQREDVSPATRRRELDSHQHLHDDITIAPPLTLAFDVKEEFRRRGRGNLVTAPMSELVRRKAMQEAKWASTRDDSPLACAIFAVDMALHWATRPLRFDIPPQSCFVQGEGRPSYFDVLKNAWVWPMKGAPGIDDAGDTLDLDPDDLPEEPDTLTPKPLMRSDLARLARLHVDIPTAGASGVVPASWLPKHRNTIFDSDVIRPPVEALVLARNVYEATALPTPISLVQTPTSLCIGTGWGGAAQSFSALLPLHWVYHQPLPYQAPSDLPAVAWQVVVLNVPSRHHWDVAKLLTRPGEANFRQHRDIIRGNGPDRGGEHVGELVQAAQRHLARGTLLVLMADRRTYEQALGLLKFKQSLTPVVVYGLDTSRQPVWVGYDEQPWAPHGLPRPTGRLVSFWRVQ